MFPKPTKQPKVKKGLKRKSSSPLKKAKEKAWKAFSLYIRTRNSSNGMSTCFTCGVVKPVSELQAGHFIAGRHGAVLFSEEGVQPQCAGCNIFHRGNQPAFYEQMKKMYGLEVIDLLFMNSNIVLKYTLADYANIEAKYKAKLADLRMESHLVMEDSV